MDAVDEADALEKMRAEIAAQYEAGGEVQTTAEESMKNLGLTSMEISRYVGFVPVPDLSRILSYSRAPAIWEEPRLFLFWGGGKHLFVCDEKRIARRARRR